MARRVYIAFLIAFLVFGLVACGDDGTGVPQLSSVKQSSVLMHCNQSAGRNFRRRLTIPQLPSSPSS